MAFILIDILILGAVAAFLFFRLRNVLGERHGEERQRPNPYDSSQSEEKTLQSPIPQDKSSAEPNEDRAYDITIRDDDTVFANGRPSQKLEAALTKIALADQNFDPAEFVHGAKSAFEMIVEAYANGDLEILETLLGKELYQTFAQGINEREKAGHRATTEILSVKQAVIHNASFSKNIAKITVRFVSDETKFIEDQNGKIISGDPGAIHETTDIWTFERDVRSDSPNWLLIETRSEE